MDYKGDSFSTQSQVDNLNARVTVLESTVVTLQNEINATNVVVAAALDKIEQLTESCLGNFTPFIFTGLVLTDITSSMQPSIGEGLFIPYSHMVSGMTLRVSVWVAFQQNPTQDFRFFLSQDSAGNFPYTFTGYEALPSQIVTANKKYVFYLMVKQLDSTSPPSQTAILSTATESAYGLLSYTTASPPSFTPFETEGGMHIHFQAQWRTAQSTQNFAPYLFTIEKITFGVA